MDGVGGIERKEESGKKRRKLPEEEIRKIVKLSKKNGATASKLARKYHVSDRNISKILKQKGINRYTKIDAWKSTPERQERQRARLNALFSGDFKLSAKKDIIYDDESYFSFQNDKASSSKHYLVTFKE